MKYQNTGVICIKCTGLIESLWNRMIKIEELNPASVHIVGYNLLTEYNCIHCNTVLQTGDLYFNDSAEYEKFIQVALEAIASKITKEIYCCKHCSGYNIHRLVHNANKGETHDLIDEYGTYITTFLEDNYLPKDMFNIVSKLLVCQECGYGTSKFPYGNSGDNKFDVWDRIYSEGEVDKFWGWDIIRFADKFDILIYENELEEFKKFLKEKPMLGLIHETGKKLYDAIKKNFDSKEYVIFAKNDILFRGRVRYQDETPYSAHQLGSPPPGKSSHGRYNSIGNSVLYCCSTKEALPYELHPNNGQIIDILTFGVNKEFRLFDMDNAFEKFEGFISSPSSESNLLKQEYLLTNFIGSCCEEVGYEGVKYSGVGNVKMNYSNYALFVNEELWTFLTVDEAIEQYKVEVTYKNSHYKKEDIDEMIGSLIKK